MLDVQIKLSLRFRQIGVYMELGGYIIALWTLIAIGFAIGESLTMSFFLLPFTVGALVALVAHLFGAPFWAQLALFLFISIALIPLLRPFARSVTKSAPRQTSGIDRLIGEDALVTERVDGMLGTGRVKVSGEDWLALGSPAQTVIESGTTATVVGVDGTRLVIKLKESAVTTN